MADLATFFEMGGYAAYVWSAYAIAFVVLALNVGLSRRELSSRIKRVQQLGIARSAEKKGIASDDQTDEVQS